MTECNEHSYSRLRFIQVHWPRWILPELNGEMDLSELSGIVLVVVLCYLRSNWCVRTKAVVRIIQCPN